MPPRPVPCRLDLVGRTGGESATGQLNDRAGWAHDDNRYAHVKVRPILADTGRPSDGGVNLLNAGWTTTVAMPDEEGFSLPGQALAVFLQADWDELNKPQRMVLELVDDEGRPATLNGSEGEPVRIDQEIVVGPVPNAPSGSPGMTQVMIDLPAGAIRTASGRGWMSWRVTVADTTESVGFWVDAPVPPPVFGSGPTSIPPLG